MIEGSNLGHYLVLLREVFNVLSKNVPEMRGDVLTQTYQEIPEGRDIIKSETVEQLRNCLLNAHQYPKASGHKETPPVPPKKNSKPRLEIEDIGEGATRRCSTVENEIIETFILLFMALGRSPPATPLRSHLRTRAVRTSQGSSSQRPKKTPPSGPRKPPNGKEMMPQEQSTKAP
ncbi:hypothetical protein F4813DRAFT_398583 [Daldinia decipiens]|uniref:uncharacterized protein n=1 Tax=Daldinia decipiens TaxID=326647 RepID=UPI0020C2C372|nr:uncharacterized protein F4813DRAFT_398583 [Daldinia decipiens]KAI1655283.1 hypothetical protein F4813DRAFT_398583 [Daldinia decipiens]